MAMWGSIIKMLLQHAPDIYAVSKQVGAARAKTAAVAESKEDLKTLHDALSARLDAIEEAHDRLRQRVRDVDSHMAFLSMLVYVGGGALSIVVIISFILALIAFINR